MPEQQERREGWAMHCYGLSVRGQVRDHNEDAFLIAEVGRTLRVRQSSLRDPAEAPHAEHVTVRALMVADGMGGHASGEVASRIALATMTSYLFRFTSWFSRLDPEHEDDLIDELKSAVEACEWSIRASAEGEPSQTAMGTTLTMAYVLGAGLYVVHAGDSRCYLLRDGSLEQITRDHTMARELVETGAADDEGSVPARLSDVLLNAVGGGPEDVRPEVSKAQLVVDDVLLLCSDGLTKHVQEEQLATLLGSGEAVEAICEKLVQAANEAGGTDNITAVVARFEEGEPTHSTLIGSDAATADPSPGDQEPGRAIAPPPGVVCSGDSDQSGFPSPCVPGQWDTGKEIGRPAEVQQRPRVSWAAVLAGVMFALMTEILIGVLGISIAAKVIGPDAGSIAPDAGALAVAAGIWVLVGGLIAVFFGGWAGGYVADTWRATEGALHGLLVWAVFSLIGLVAILAATWALLAGHSGMLTLVFTAVAESVAPRLASVSGWVFLSLLLGAVVASIGGAGGRRRCDSGRR